MKMNRILIAGGLLAALALAPLFATADDAKPEVKTKPYPLKTCVVSGEKLGGDMTPYTFTNNNQEVKLCCKGCLATFKKDEAKYLKKIDDEAAKK